MVGGHAKTKMYMAASNKDWTAPRIVIFGLFRMIVRASEIILLVD
jgi:hypothetical protein